MTFTLHISGLLNEEKVDIGDAKVDIDNEKVDIENVLSQKGSDFSVKTTVHIHRLFEKFGFDEVFGSSIWKDVMEQIHILEAEFVFCISSTITT